MSVRRLGQLVECIHAPVYFAPEAQQAYAALGLRGYWRGYFASRAAALGTPSAAEVTRLFGGFAPAMVSRAIPEVWSLTTPTSVLAVRLSSAVAALTRLELDRDETLERAAPHLTALVDHLDLTGRPMAAAHAALHRPADPLASLWHDCTILREYRGDAHLAVLAEADLSWPRPHLLLAALGRLDLRQREYRGWTEEEWQTAADDLDRRGLFAAEVAAALVERIERETDDAVGSAIAVDEASVAARMLEPLALRAAAELPFPNAIGLPRPVAGPN